MDPRRAVQLAALSGTGTLKLGSGFRVVGDRVLTAAHVVSAAHTLTARFVPELGRVYECGAETLWADVEADLAVVRLVSNGGEGYPSGSSPETETVEYGRFAELVTCEALGFPRFKLRNEQRGSGSGALLPYREPHHAVGRTSAHSNRREGSLEIRLDVAPGSDPDPEHSPWEGMSGAAVFVDGRIVGVVTRHYGREGLGLLTASRVDHWYQLLAPGDVARLHELIGLPQALDGLADVDSATAGSTAATPTALNQLPLREGMFTGRTKQLNVLAGLLAPDSRSDKVAVSVIAGLAGVGKSALALEAAHAAVAARWFGGGILLNLHGYDDTPVGAAQALDALLRALGVPGKQVPADEQARIELYHSVLAAKARPVLIVADNASASEQVRMLLPRDARHHVLVTSRHTLTGLGARLLELTVLPTGEAVTLLDSALRTASPTDARITGDARTAARIARYCGFLPLALQIAAALLAIDPGKPLSELSAELANATSRLTYLNDGERAVRAPFELSYQRLGHEHSRMFRFLALNPGPDLATPAAAVLAGQSIEQAQLVLRELARAHMLERAPVRGRWQMHDLIRDYARELAANDPDYESSGATDRLLNYYSQAVRAADQHFYLGRTNAQRQGEPAAGQAVTQAVPQFATQEDAIAWLYAERQNLEACVAQPPDQDAARAIGIAHGMAVFLHRAGYWQQAVVIHQAAATRAQSVGDQAGRADALADLGRVQYSLAEYAAAAASHTEALSIYRALSIRVGEADSLVSLGRVRYSLGDYAAAIDSHSTALSLHRANGDRLGQANALTCRGDVQYAIGEYAAASAGYTEALGLYRDLGEKLGQADAFDHLGQVQREIGEYAAASASHTEALALFGALGSRLGQANALDSLGTVQFELGEYAAASASHTEALDLYRGLGSRLGQANALTGLGRVQSAMGEHSDGVGNYLRALDMYRAIGNRSGEVWALNYYAALVSISDPPRGRALHEDALRLAKLLTSPWDEARALEGIAVTYQSEGSTAVAASFFRTALELYRTMGCTADVARVEALLVS